MPPEDQEFQESDLVSDQAAKMSSLLVKELVRLKKSKYKKEAMEEILLEIKPAEDSRHERVNDILLAAHKYLGAE
jgi:hypothetical protein